MSAQIKDDQKLMQEIADNWSALCDQYWELKPEVITKNIHYMYNKVGIKTPPVVMYFCSPMQLQYVANFLSILWNADKSFFKNIQTEEQRLKLQEDLNISSLKVMNPEKYKDVEVPYTFPERHKLEYFPYSLFGNLADYGWIANHEYRIKIGHEKPEDYDQFREMMLGGVHDMIQCEEVCLVCEKAVETHRNANRDFHNAEGGAIKWKDGFQAYLINGRHMPAWIFEQGFTAEQFIKESNSDVRAGMVEILLAKGLDHMMEFLEAQVVDEKTITHRMGLAKYAQERIPEGMRQTNDTETLTLYKSKKKIPGITNLKQESPAHLAWLRFVCPSTGTNYLINTDSSFTDAVEAAKFHRPQVVPASLPYDWDSRS